MRTMRTSVILGVSVWLVIIFVGLSYYAAAETNSSDPNSIAAEPNEPVRPPSAGNPRKIVMPKNTKLPTRYKCPVHGVVTNLLLNIEIDGVVHTYCKKCAMQLIVDVLDLNLPKLEVISEDPTTIKEPDEDG